MTATQSETNVQESRKLHAYCQRKLARIDAQLKDTPEGWRKEELREKREECLADLAMLNQELKDAGVSQEPEGPVEAMNKAVSDARSGRLSLGEAFSTWKEARARLRRDMMKSLTGQVVLGEEGLCNAAVRGRFMQDFPNLGDPEGWFPQQ